MTVKAFLFNYRSGNLGPQPVRSRAPHHTEQLTESFSSPALACIAECYLTCMSGVVSNTLYSKFISEHAASSFVIGRR